MRPQKQTGSDLFDLWRDAGLSVEAAAQSAGISLKFAKHRENLRNREAGRVVFEPSNRDDALVDALLARGGYPRLSEKMGRLGHVACLPLIPFEVRP